MKSRIFTVTTIQFVIFLTCIFALRVLKANILKSLANVMFETTSLPPADRFIRSSFITAIILQKAPVEILRYLNISKE